MPATVDIVTPNLVVNPGEAVSTQLRLTNTGRVVDEITVEILGDAGPFASVDPAALPLFPGAHGVVTVTFRPPRGTSPLAGIMPVGFRVRSREDPAFSYVAEARLEIGAVLDVGARLSPRNSVAGRIGQGARHRVELENAGNSVARVTIAAGDPDDRLSFRIATPVVLVPPGGRTNVTISVGTRDPDVDRGAGDAAVPGRGQPRWSAADHARRLAAAASRHLCRDQPDPDRGRRGRGRRPAREPAVAGTRFLAEQHAIAVGRGRHGAIRGACHRRFIAECAGSEAGPNTSAVGGADRCQSRQARRPRRAR